MVDPAAGGQERLVPVFIPALIAILVNREKSKGSPLTREEVMEIRDNGVCMMMSEARAAEMARSRGYRDIDPEACWEEWQAFLREREADES